MLAYCKTVLEKVHFDQSLFYKEYRKSLRWLSKEEHHHLQSWLAERFGMPTLSPSTHIVKHHAVGMKHVKLTA